MLDPRSSMSGYGRFSHLRLRQCQRLTQRYHSGAIVERESGGILYTCVCVTIDVDERCELGFIVTTEEQQEQQTKRKRKCSMKPRKQSDVGVSKCHYYKINLNEAVVLSQCQIHYG